MSNYNNMQKIKASELFKNIKNIDNKEFDNNDNINLDFSDIEDIDLKAITILLNIQKVALLNNKTISMSNVNSDVSKVLDVTGLNKTFANISNPIIRKFK